MDCRFYGNGRCSVLNTTNCTDCKFKKTEFEYQHDKDMADKMLADKNLRRIQKHLSDGRIIMSVERIK